MSTQSIRDLKWDPFGRIDDPYPIYEALRELAPMYHNPERGFWALSRFADVQAANRDWQAFSYAQGVNIDNVGTHLSPGNFLDEDPPLHTMLRAAVKDKFRVGVLREAMTPSVEVEVDQLLAEVAQQDSFDFGMQCAFELPIRIGSHLLGFPAQDCDTLRGIADQAFMQTSGPPGSSDAAAAAEAAIAIRHYFEEQIDERRRHPQADLLTQIATATVDGASIGSAAAGLAALIFGGSVDTTALTLTNAVNLLGQHPDQRAWLLNNPELMDQAIEEVLRFESPIQVFKRTTTTAVEAHATTIPSGVSVFLIYGSANRDPRQFDRPEEFDIRRKFTRHITFGEGIHHCLGAPLARLEATTMLRRFLQLFPDYEVADAQQAAPGHVRGFRSLRIARS